MKKYRVLCHEVCAYEVIVEAETQEKAEEMLWSGEIDIPKPYDRDDFGIDEITELK